MGEGKIISSKDLTRSELQFIMLLRSLRRYERVEIKYEDDDDIKNKKLAITKISKDRLTIDLDQIDLD